ncbi:transcription repressor OFP13-like [Solanum dulcamara]|uniref:transcription repressor OFP13-like n=1 Tax=Solanum dulcamara TaxID=45834 RepID=UPI0024852195|nr:transcription repressor OFP13-like [Solanum dulcamara]
MAKKLKISSIFKKKEIGLATWQWPSCTHSKTLSFRADDNIFKTINSVFFDPFDGIETPQSSFTNSSSDQSSTSNIISIESHEEIIKGARSERLFFEQVATSSIFHQEPKVLLCKKNQEPQEENQENDLPFKESVILAMESKDPYLDFKKSMKEMVESQGIKDWDNLQELLAWYLKLNGEVNHGFILGAFVDLLMELVIPTTPSTNSDNSITSYSSVVSSSFSCPSSPLSSLGHKDTEEQENANVP